MSDDATNHDDNGISSAINAMALETMPSNINNNTTKKRKCSVCGVTGHDKRNCPSSIKDAAINLMQVQQQHIDGAVDGAILADPDEFLHTSGTGTAAYLPGTYTCDTTKCIYVLFDLETTGFSREKDHVIELAAIVLDKHGKRIVNNLELATSSTFSSLVKPPREIPWIITNITTIDDEMVSKFPDFGVVGRSFCSFLKEREKDWKYKFPNEEVESFIFVAHNGKAFDVPFLIRQMQRYNIVEFDEYVRKMFILDTLVIARDVFENYNQPNYKLSSVYKYITTETFSNAHRALADVHAVESILCSEKVWLYRIAYVHKVDMFGKVVVDPSQVKQNSKNKKSKKKQKELEEQLRLAALVPNDDSDSADESYDDDIEDDNTDEDDEELQWDDEDGTQVSIFTEGSGINEGWNMNCMFSGVDGTRLFEEVLLPHPTRNTTIPDKTIGLQISPNTVNSPIKAFRTIFYKRIMNMIVKYTNEYGSINYEKWQDICEDDLMEFIAVLFIASVQRRKDQPKDWFSDDPIIQCDQIKKVMSGKKFSLILRFLHCCSVENQLPTNHPNYDPIYKVDELRNMLEARFHQLFVAGEMLSLDESLIRAFGRISFKVRIIMKSARYGIKIYVLTDAETSYVLRTIVYTGRTTYGDEEDKDTKKTVQVVKELCQEYAGTHRTVFVDRFYTSVDLLKALDEMDLYITGTCQRNRLPKELTVPKKTKAFKDMLRGDSKKHVYKYKTNNQQEKQYGLVAWKDRDMVYCLTNRFSTEEDSTCFRRTNQGIKELPRPMVINKYNKYMGGVDLADKRRLHCNSTIMGQRRWWLKLFFYYLDVGTNNALVLYRLAMGLDDNYPIKEFKTSIIDSLVGDRISDKGKGGSIDITTAHAPVKLPGGERKKCAACAYYFPEKRIRTRYVCGNPDCQLPLCTMGSGKVDHDCFQLIHSDEDVYEKTMQQYQIMKRYTTNHNKSITNQKKANL